MRFLLKIRKIKISIFFLLLFNQFLYSSYAVNHKNIYRLNSVKQNSHSKLKKESKILLSEISNKDNQSIIIDTKNIEEYIENIYGPNNLDDFKEKTNRLQIIKTTDDNSGKDFIKKDIDNKNLTGDKTNQPTITNTNLDKSDKDFIKKDIDNKNLTREKTNQSTITNTNLDKSDKDSINKDIDNKNLTGDKKNYSDKLKNKKSILKKDSKDKLPLPSKSIISTSEFKVPSRGYVNLKGPKITLNLEEADSLETLKLLGKLGNYGIVIVNPDGIRNEKNLITSKITANFDQLDISEVFNSILLSANLQAIVEGNIIFVGKNILNKSIKPKVSKTYRLNQVNAASVADYLSTLGAKISKVLLVSGTLEGTEVKDGNINKKEFKDELKNSYSIEGGPLFGLIGTTDLRLQTITLIGSKDLINTAEKYIKSLDIRHRQVALTIKIIDVSLTKTDLKQNIFEFKTGETEVTNSSGLGIKTANFRYGLAENANIPNIFRDGLSGGNFFNWLEAKITNDKAKVLASPTLILGENPNFLASGAAAVDDKLATATIGRPFKNEGFIKVGETVITGFEQTVSDGGVVACTATQGTSGITFGAKLEKIDDNGFVTFALSPAISSVTKTVEIAGCGIQNTLSVRKLDTGSIRVKNGDTLILTGVLKDEDNVSISKVPIFGDIPVLGNLFRKNSTQKRKSELIILVTPKILEDK